MSDFNRADYLVQARRLHAHSVVLDSHVDTTQRLLDPQWDFTARDRLGHVDLPRLREGGVNAVVFAVWSPASVEPGASVNATRRQIAAVKRLVAAHGESLAFAQTGADVRDAAAAGKVAVLIGIEGGHLIEQSLDVLREFRAEGAVYLTLTHGVHNALADSAGIHVPLAPHHGGLSALGRTVVAELNRLGMLVDVSHVSDDTFHDVAKLCGGPLVASHSACRAVNPHRRNLSDDMLRTIAAGGGVVQVTFPAAFVDPSFPPIDPTRLPRASLTPADPARPLFDHVTPLLLLVDHFDHALRIVGPDHVGIGSDFDGTLMLPKGMEDCSRLPHLTAALLERGWSEDDLVKVLGENMLRVLKLAASAAENAVT